MNFGKILHQKRKFNLIVSSIKYLGSSFNKDYTQHNNAYTSDSSTYAGKLKLQFFAGSYKGNLLIQTVTPVAVLILPRQATLILGEIASKIPQTSRRSLIK